MIENIRLIKKNIVEFEIKGEESLKNFISIFTTLDKNVVAKTISNTNNIRIKYETDHDLTRVSFIADGDFIYKDIENILVHIKYSNQEVKGGVPSALLEIAKKKLTSSGVIFCMVKKKITCSLSIEDYNNVSISPISEKFMEFLTNDKRLIDELNHNKQLYSYVVLKGSIRVINILDIHKTIESIAEILVKLEVIEKSEQKNIESQIISLSLKALANNQLRVMDNITQYPTNHPLSKYKNFAQDTKDLLFHLADDSLNESYVRKLKSAINKEQEFSLAPPVIMRSFGQLQKNFPQELDEIISKYNIS